MGQLLDGKAEAVGPQRVDDDRLLPALGVGQHEAGVTLGGLDRQHQPLGRRQVSHGQRPVQRPAEDAVEDHDRVLGRHVVPLAEDPAGDKQHPAPADRALDQERHAAGVPGQRGKALLLGQLAGRKRGVGVVLLRAGPQQPPRLRLVPKLLQADPLLALGLGRRRHGRQLDQVPVDLGPLPAVLLDLPGQRADHLLTGLLAHVGLDGLEEEGPPVKGLEPLLRFLLDAEILAHQAAEVQQERLQHPAGLAGQAPDHFRLKRGGQDAQPVEPGRVVPGHRVEGAAGRQHQRPPLLDVLPQQRHRVGRVVDAGDHHQPGVFQRLASVPGELLDLQMADLDQLRLPLSPAPGCQQVAQPVGLAVDVPRRVLVRPALVDKHHRQRGDHRHDQLPLVVAGQLVVGDGNLGGNRRWLARLHRHVELVGRKLDLGGLARLQGDGLRGGRGPVDGQRYLHVVARRVPLVPDLGQEHGRNTQVGQPVLDLEILHPGVLALLGADPDDLDRAGELLEVGLQRLHAPVAGLLVGEQDNLLRGRGGDPPAGLLGQIDGHRGRGLAIDRPHGRQGLQRVLLGAIGAAAELRLRAAQRQHRDPASRRQPVDVVLGPLPGLVQDRPVELLVGHAEAVVHQQHGVDRLAGIDRRRGGLAVGLRQRQAKQEDTQGSDGQEEQVAQPEDPPAAADRLAKKLHGRPVDHLEPLPVQQVDQDRSGSRRQSRNRKPLEVQG